MLLVTLAMLGGLLGVSMGLHQTIGELSLPNRQFAIIGGLVCGIIPTVILGGIVQGAFRNHVVTFLVSVTVAVFIPMAVLYAFTSGSASV
jgi:hypothetical protein